MNTTTTLAAALTALALVTVSCGEKKTVPHDHDGDGKPDHADGAHPQAVPHDHDGDGKPDHGPDAHEGHDHNGEDHKGHDHDSGEHKGHDHDAEDQKGHDHAKKIAGPNGGKVITAVEPHAEFLVTADRKVRITFLGEDNKPVEAGTQSINIVCGDRSSPTVLTPVKEADGMSFLSANKLPEGNNFPTIVTFKTSEDAAPVRAKFTLNMSDCPNCDYLEYSCTCEHSH